MLGYMQEISNIPTNNATQKDIDKLYNDLVAFKEDEFAALLHRCHNIIRNIDKLDPAAAFDEIAKILFMKVYVERTLLKGENKKFNLDWLQEAKKYNTKPIENYFEEAKKALKTRLVLQKLVKDENIQISHEEFHEKLHEIAHAQNKTCEEVEKSLSEYEVSYIQNDILMNKIIALLKSKNK